MNERDHIFVMKSFLLLSEMNHPETFSGNKNSGIEWGTTILFGSMEQVEDYLQKLCEGKDDRPFECRWKYLIVEKVYFGPYSHNEIMGWWKGTRQSEESILGYDVVKLDSCPIKEEWAEHTANWTISS